MDAVRLILLGVGIIGLFFLYRAIWRSFAKESTRGRYRARKRRFH